jgi:serine/threonine protein kinase
MQTPPLPPENPGRAPDEPVPTEQALSPPAPAPAEGPSTIVRQPAPPTDAAGAVPISDEDVLADLFGGEDIKATDDSPTVISKHPPKPADAPGFAIGDMTPGMAGPLPISEPAGRAPERGADRENLLRGRRLAHFELLEPVGVGGMAAVIRARDTQLDRTVALKVLPPEMAADPENVRRFHQEARSAAKLDHENIARVFYCGEDQQLHFIAFEFVEGENLRALMERRGRLPVPEALHYMLQIATGLAHAAARGVVHRDIKPSNIIITPNGRAKLVDMGLARMSETQTDEGLTHSGVTLGTFDYISPEQALEPRAADVRSDIYSLGCTFYHVLTGHPSVPEGTAAKKLHHHQHEPPLDPRQLNTDIPDEVAAILARMMAKDPNLRYQRAEHLVQHLLLAAQNIGPTASAQPHGVLFVDAPLPDPPRTRPLLVVGLAAMILFVTIWLLGRTGKTSDGSKDWPFLRPVPASGTNGQAKAPEIEPNPGSGRESTGPMQRVLKREVATEREFLAVAREQHSDDPELDLVLTSPTYSFPLELDGESVALPPLSGRKITIRAKDPSKRPTIRFTSSVKNGPAADFVWMGLFIDSNDVTVDNVRFVLDGARGAKLGRMSGVVLRGRDKLATGKERFILRNCEFIQAGQAADPDADRPSSVLLSAVNRAWQPTLRLEDCYFVGYEEAVEDKFKNAKYGGQDAVTLKSMAKVVATNCAFGPHAAMFRIDPGAEGSELRVLHCAGLLLGESAVFHVAGETTTCSLVVRQSWWAGLNSAELAPAQGKVATLLRQDGLGDNAIAYQGTDNRFNHLNSFWVRPAAAEVVAADLDAFSRKMSEDSTELPPNVRFWKEGDPLTWLDAGEPSKAFQVNDRLPQLRIGGKQLVGLSHWGKLLFTAADEKPAVARSRVLVFDPSLAKAGDAAYKNLTGAFAEIKPDEEVEIQLKFNGLKEMTPVLVKDGIKVTIHPALGYHPIVSVQKSENAHSFLVRVLDGEATLEDLEFRVQPSDPNMKSQVLAGLVGDGRCAFKKCVITLDPIAKTVPVAVASVSDPDAFKMMRDTPTTQATGKGPRLAIENCLIRGDGDLIASHGTRPVMIDVTNVWMALAGSILSCDGARDETAQRADTDQPTQLGLKQVTAYLGGNLLRLRDPRDRDFKSVTPVQVVSANCIFQAGGSNKSLVHLEGPDPGQELLKSLVQWSADSNWYGGFENLLDNQTNGSTMPAPPIGRIAWMEWPGEKDPHPLQMPVLTPQGSDPLTQALPEHFKLKSDVPAGRGAVLVTLPRPNTDAGPRNE